jgi:hypothetical protein
MRHSEQLPLNDPSTFHVYVPIASSKQKIALAHERNSHFCGNVIVDDLFDENACSLLRLEVRTSRNKTLAIIINSSSSSNSNSTTMNRDYSAQLAAAPSPQLVEREQREHERTLGSGERMTPLAIDFVPTADDVICGR